MVVDASASEELSAILLAVWEGRGEPTPSELDLFGLIGLQAGTAIDHALLYARVRSQADELNRLAAIQSDFLRGVTHDLQTPLTSIRAVADELGQSPTLDEAARADLDSIAHQAERLRRMVSQLLVASRLEVGVGDAGAGGAQGGADRAPHLGCAARRSTLRAGRRRPGPPAGRRSGPAGAGALGGAGQRGEVQPAGIAGHGAPVRRARRMAAAGCSPGLP